MNLLILISGLRRKIEEGKIEMKKLDSKKEEIALINVEKELWESGDWRENIKDLVAKVIESRTGIIVPEHSAVGYSRGNGMVEN